MLRRKLLILLLAFFLLFLNFGYSEVVGQTSSWGAEPSDTANCYSSKTPAFSSKTEVEALNLGDSMDVDDYYEFTTTVTNKIYPDFSSQTYGTSSFSCDCTVNWKIENSKTVLVSSNTDSSYCDVSASFSGSFEKGNALATITCSVNREAFSNNNFGDGVYEFSSTSSSTGYKVIVDNNGAATKSGTFTSNSDVSKKGVKIEGCTAGCDPSKPQVCYNPNANLFGPFKYQELRGLSIGRMEVYENATEGNRIINATPLAFSFYKPGYYPLKNAHVAYIITYKDPSNTDKEKKIVCRSFTSSKGFTSVNVSKILDYYSTLYTNKLGKDVNLEEYYKETNVVTCFTKNSNACAFNKCLEAYLEKDKDGSPYTIPYYSDIYSGSPYDKLSDPTYLDFLNDRDLGYFYLKTCDEIEANSILYPSPYTEDYCGNAYVEYSVQDKNGQKLIKEEPTIISIARFSLFTPISPKEVDQQAYSLDICFPAVLLFGLLFAAMYATGNNPFFFFDLSRVGSARALRVNYGRSGVGSFTYTDTKASDINRAVNKAVKGALTETKAGKKLSEKVTEKVSKVLDKVGLNIKEEKEVKKGEGKEQSTKAVVKKKGLINKIIAGGKRGVKRTARTVAKETVAVASTSLLTQGIVSIVSGRGLKGITIKGAVRDVKERFSGRNLNRMLVGTVLGEGIGWALGWLFSSMEKLKQRDDFLGTLTRVFETILSIILGGGEIEKYRGKKTEIEKETEKRAKQISFYNKLSNMLFTITLGLITKKRVSASKLGISTQELSMLRRDIKTLSSSAVPAMMGEFLKLTESAMEKAQNLGIDLSSEEGIAELAEFALLDPKNEEEEKKKKAALYLLSLLNVFSTSNPTLMQNYIVSLYTRYKEGDKKAIAMFGFLSSIVGKENILNVKKAVQLLPKAIHSYLHMVSALKQRGLNYTAYRVLREINKAEKEGYTQEGLVYDKERGKWAFVMKKGEEEKKIEVSEKQLFVLANGRVVTSLKENGKVKEIKLTPSSFEILDKVNALVKEGYEKSFKQDEKTGEWYVILKKGNEEKKIAISYEQKVLLDENISIIPAIKGKDGKVKELNLGFANEKLNAVSKVIQLQDEIVETANSLDQPEEIISFNYKGENPEDAVLALQLYFLEGNKEFGGDFGGDREAFANLGFQMEILSRFAEKRLSKTEIYRAAISNVVRRWAFDNYLNDLGMGMRIKISDMRASLLSGRPLDVFSGTPISKDMFIELFGEKGEQLFNALFGRDGQLNPDLSSSPFDHPNIYSLAMDVAGTQINTGSALVLSLIEQYARGSPNSSLNLNDALSLYSKSENQVIKSLATLLYAINKDKSLLKDERVQRVLAKVSAIGVANQAFGIPLVQISLLPQQDKDEIVSVVNELRGNELREKNEAIAEAEEELSSTSNLINLIEQASSEDENVSSQARKTLETELSKEGGLIDQLLSRPYEEVKEFLEQNGLENFVTAAYAYGKTSKEKRAKLREAMAKALTNKLTEETKVANAFLSTLKGKEIDLNTNLLPSSTVSSAAANLLYIANPENTNIDKNVQITTNQVKQIVENPLITENPLIAQRNVQELKGVLSSQQTTQPSDALSLQKYSGAYNALKLIHETISLRGEYILSKGDINSLLIALKERKKTATKAELRKIQELERKLEEAKQQFESNENYSPSTKLAREISKNYAYFMPEQLVETPSQYNITQQDIVESVANMKYEWAKDLSKVINGEMSYDEFALKHKIYEMDDKELGIIATTLFFSSSALQAQHEYLERKGQEPDENLEKGLNQTSTALLNTSLLIKYKQFDEILSKKDPEYRRFKQQYEQMMSNAFMEYNTGKATLPSLTSKAGRYIASLFTGESPSRLEAYREMIGIGAVSAYINFGKNALPVLGEALNFKNISYDTTAYNLYQHAILPTLVSPTNLNAADSYLAVSPLLESKEKPKEKPTPKPKKVEPPKYYEIKRGEGTWHLAEKYLDKNISDIAAKIGVEEQQIRNNKKLRNKILWHIMDVVDSNLEESKGINIVEKKGEQYTTKPISKNKDLYLHAEEQEKGRIRHRWKAPTKVVLNKNLKEEITARLISKVGTKQAKQSYKLNKIKTNIKKPRASLKKKDITTQQLKPIKTQKTEKTKTKTKTKKARKATKTKRKRSKK